MGASGSMKNNGAVTKTFTPSASSQSYTIPAGYHNGSGKVTCNAVSGFKLLASGYTCQNAGNVTYFGYTTNGWYIDIKSKSTSYASYTKYSFIVELVTAASSGATYGISGTFSKYYDKTNGRLFIILMDGGGVEVITNPKVNVYVKI